MSVTNYSRWAVRCNRFYMPHTKRLWMGDSFYISWQLFHATNTCHAYFSKVHLRVKIVESLVLNLISTKQWSRACYMGPHFVRIARYWTSLVLCRLIAISPQKCYIASRAGDFRGILLSSTENCLCAAGFTGSLYLSTSSTVFILTASWLPKG